MAWKGENPGANENPPGSDNGGSGFLPWDFRRRVSRRRRTVRFSQSLHRRCRLPRIGGQRSLRQPSPSPTRSSRSPIRRRKRLGRCAKSLPSEMCSAPISTARPNTKITPGLASHLPSSGSPTRPVRRRLILKQDHRTSSAISNWRYDDLARVNGDFGVDAGGASIAPTDTSDGSSFSLEVLSSSTGRFTFDGLSLDINFIAGVPKSVFFISFDNAESMDGDYNEDGVVAQPTTPCVARPSRPAVHLAERECRSNARRSDRCLAVYR